MTFLRQLGRGRADAIASVSSAQATVLEHANKHLGLAPGRDPRIDDFMLRSERERSGTIEWPVLHALPIGSDMKSNQRTTDKYAQLFSMKPENVELHDVLARNYIHNIHRKGWYLFESLPNFLPKDYTRDQKLVLTNGKNAVSAWRNRATRRLATERERERLQRAAQSSVRSQNVSRLSRSLLLPIMLCAYCGKQGDELVGPDGKLWHMDHIMPLSRGGKDCVTNIVKACAWCNLSKGSKIKTPLDGTPTAAAMLHRSPTLVES